MGYRKDSDLEFLATADNEDLCLLADVLVYKDAKHLQEKSPRGTSTLWLDDDYDSCYPNQMRYLWKSIAEELQKFGGHSGVNWLFRGNKGVLYREILIDVCKRQKVKGVDFSTASVVDLENAFLERVVVMALERMSDSERRELVQGLRNVPDFKDIMKDALLSKNALLSVVKYIFRKGGFKSYILTLQVVNGLSRAVLGRGLTFGANAALMRGVGSFISGPLGWAFTIVTTLWSMMGPNQDVCMKGVAIVAYMRKKKMLGYNSAA